MTLVASALPTKFLFLAEGYCNNANLCKPGSSLAACQGAKSDGYLTECLEACAQQRCIDEPTCGGYTTNVEASGYQLKEAIHSTTSAQGYTCHRKDDKAGMSLSHSVSRRVSQGLG